MHDSSSISGKMKFSQRDISRNVRKLHIIFECAGVFLNDHLIYYVLVYQLKTLQTKKDLKKKLRKNKKIVHPGSRLTLFAETGKQIANCNSSGTILVVSSDDF